jgi:hypothetical protein
MAGKVRMSSPSGIVTRDSLRRTQAARPDWALEKHASEVYDVLRFHGTRPPPLHRGIRYPRIQHLLMRWKADLGARHRIDWPGFIRRHRNLLQPLARLPRLGRLSEAQIAFVCETVFRLDAFKGATRHLVFGSKAAHFHFPGLVPVMSSDVERALRCLQSDVSGALREALDDSGPWFRFSTPAGRQESYRHYVRLGNRLTSEIDQKEFLDGICRVTYPLHAAIFDACIIAFDPEAKGASEAM